MSNTLLVVTEKRRVGGWWSVRCIETIRHTGLVVHSNETNARTDGRPPTLPWFPPSLLTTNPNWVLNSGLLCGVVHVKGVVVPYQQVKSYMWAANRPTSVDYSRNKLKTKILVGALIALSALFLAAWTITFTITEVQVRWRYMVKSC